MASFSARKLPQQLSPSGWLAILPPRAAKPQLEGNVTADIAVIGGGLPGLRRRAA